MTFTKLTATALLLVIAVIAGNAQGYTITGNVSGLHDSTWLYLRLGDSSKDVDSARIIHSQFAMSGRLAEQPAPVFLHTLGYKQYVYFWLENTAVSVSADAHAFKKATITGSATENEARQLAAITAPLVHREDSLETILDTVKNDSDRSRLQMQLYMVREEHKQLDKNYVKAHPGSLIATNLLSLFASTWGKPTTTGLYNNLTPAMKATRYGQQINDFIKFNQDLHVGSTYANFEQTNTAGKKIKLSDIKGKYVLLDFWASWCGPCRGENANLIQTYARFKEKGFAVLGVSLDESKADWLQAIKEDKLVWENVSDLKGDHNRAAIIYSINAIPSNFLIDQNGIIIGKNLRGEKLDAKLQELLP